MKLKKSKKTSLRIIAISVLTLLFIALLVTILFVNQRVNHRQKYIADDGYITFHDTLSEEPVYLNGEWEKFDNILCENSEEVLALQDSASYIKFPITTSMNAASNATYRLRFSLPKEEKDTLYLFIPNLLNNANVYLNGTLLSFETIGTTWLSNSAMGSMLRIDGLDANKEWQELVISGSFSEQDRTLYKRPVIIGTINNIAALADFSSSNEMFLLGLLLLILINGYVFMMFRPGHKIISMMTLFDTMILLRTLLSMNYVIAFVKEIFPWFNISDSFASSLSLSFLMVGGIVGCKLSTVLYDPEGKVTSWIIRVMPWMYAVFAVIFPFQMTFFETYGKYILFIVYGLTFLGVFMQFKVGLQNKQRRVYFVLQFVKTSYIGVIVLLDILFWSESADMLMLFYLYSLFFVMHVIVRLYDNNESYSDVEILNASLEETVEKRTKELSEANKILSELSIKDPLTKIYNRLHFEKTMEMIEANYENEMPIYLCMFDLDFFKNINDTYGHDAGDEQLQALAQLVKENIREEVLFARIGGEEFVLLYTKQSKQEVLKNIEQIHNKIVNDAALHESHTTASFGIACGIDSDTPKELLKRADIALYEAKHRGRNRIVVNCNDKLELIEEGNV